MLEQDAVHGGITGQGLERVDQFGGRRGGGQGDVPRLDAGLAAPVLLHTDVCDRGGVLADQHGGETGRRTRARGEVGRPLGGLLHDAARETGAVHEPGLGHELLLSVVDTIAQARGKDPLVGPLPGGHPPQRQSRPVHHPSPYDDPPLRQGGEACQ